MKAYLTFDVQKIQKIIYDENTVYKVYSKIRGKFFWYGNIIVQVNNEVE